MSEPVAVNSPDDIAIVGMAGRFPGARDLDEFWRNLCEGVDSISLFSDEELERAGVSRARLSDPNYVKAGGVVEDVELFDAAFFGFTPREAEVADPQQRVFLECAWSALENAGYDPETFRGRVGLYAGAATNGYLLNVGSNPDLIESVGMLQALIGNEKDHLTTQVSYRLNLRGPSVAVQTTCSTSLVAVSMACQSLLCYQSDMALAGGVSVKVPQKTGHLYKEGGITSPDGRCRTFDAEAKGIVGGDGVGVVVLKRLDDALADGDYVHAVIKASAINNDGSLKIGYTAPSVDGQAEVVAEALAMARISPETVTYVEAHGTGTALGDPIEVVALTQAYRASTKRSGFCALGSVKTNVGHLNTAAGVAGLIKTALALRHKRLPPSLHFERPNPRIDFASSPFFVNTKLTEWAAGDAPRRAGVSSFGIGGTNAHVILEEAPPPAPPAKRRPQQLLVLSARTETALEAATAALAKHLRRNPDLDMADVAYTLQVGRRSFRHRRALVCEDADGAVKALEAKALEAGDAGRVLTGEAQTAARPVVMMFPGQGAQHLNMARELYRHEKTFREQVNLCCDLLLPHLKYDLRDVMYREESSASEGADGLDRTFIAQPALFVVEYALARLWMEWGVRPEAMIGHSVGEYIAACLAGVMSLQDALALVAARGRLMQQLPCGAMLAVPVPEEEALALVAGDRSLSLAAVNAPSLSVVSGPAESIERLAARCSEGGIYTRRLHTSHAFHSAMMEPVLEAFLRHVRGVRLSPPQIPYISNLTGRWITDAEATSPDYWAAHLRQTVRFSEGVAELAKNPARVFLEVGPGRTLGDLVRQTRSQGAAPTVVSTLPHPRENESDTASALGALGRLWLAGAQVDWEGFNADRRRRVPLPTYPFERQRYWVERAQGANAVREASADTRPDAAGRFYAPVWTQSPRRTLPSAAAGAEASGTLVLSDDYGLGAALAQRLKESSGDVVTVGMGVGFEKVGESAYVVSPSRPQDYDLLLEELQSRGEAPRRIVHLWGVSPDAEDERAATEFSEAYQARGYYSLLLLAQALGRRDRGRPLEIDVVSNNLHSVVGGEALCPPKATIIGACKAVQQELPQVSCRSVDVALAGPRGGEAVDLAEQLLGEFAAGGAEEAVAYRGGRRWVRRFEPVRLGQQAESGAGLREGGVYLITGGLRGIGLALAEHLARTKGAKLILTESSDFPPRDEWDSWPEAHGEQHEVSLRIRKLRALEEAGGGLLVVAASPFTPEVARAAVAEARGRFGRIDGVIHTELDSDPAFVQTRAAGVGADALSKNVRGTLLLQSLLKDARPDFLALFSSAGSIVGAPGQADLCATGAFLDALAHYNSLADGPSTIAVDWDAPRWEDVPESLLPIVPEYETHLRQLREKHGLSLEDGVDAFERLVSSGLTQAVVSTRSFAPAPEQTDALDRERLYEELRRRAAPQACDTRGGQESGYEAPGSEVEKRIAEAWQEVLGVERVGVRDRFFDLGGNSLLGIQLVSRLRKIFLLELPMTILFESQTVAEQASVVSETRRKEQEMEELEMMLKEIEGLSDEDLDRRLAAVEAPGGDGVR